MTSSHKRVRRGSRRKAALRRGLMLGAGMATCILTLIAAIALWHARPDAAGAQEAVARSVALLAGGNASAARAAALEAVRADGGNGDAHAALARAMLAQQDGVGAETELRQAADSGVPARSLAHLRAHALLIEGQPERALAEAANAEPRYRAYAMRMRSRALAALGRFPEGGAALNEALRLARNDPAVWIDITHWKRDSSDIAGAIVASEEAARLGPNNVEALVVRAEMVRTQYGLVAALPWFEAALRHDPQDHDALIGYAATLGDAGRAMDSLAATRRALAARPGSPQALYLQAVIAARAGNATLARSLLDRPGNVIATVPGALLLGGALDIEARDYGQAIDKLRPLVADQPANLAATKLLATALLRSEAAGDAVALLAPLVARSDADAYLLTLAARGYERLGDRAAAAKLLDRAPRLAPSDAPVSEARESLAVLGLDAAQRPDDPGAIGPLVRGMLSEGDTAGALAKARDFATRLPGNPAAHIVLGDAWMAAGHFDQAVTAYRNAANMRFDQPTALRLIGALDRADHRDDAARTLALFLSQNPVNVAALRLSGAWRLAAGQYDAAIATIERLRARIGDGDATVNAQLAAAYAGKGRFDLATRFGEAAYALAPGSPATADAYGWALYKSGDAAAAVELVQKAVVLAPREAGLRWHLAQIYAALDRAAEARTQAQAALADPHFAERAAAEALASG